MKRERLIEALNVAGPLIGFLLIYGLFAIFADTSFTSWRSFVTILRQTAIVGTAAVGATAVIIAAGIDLSAGSVIALSCVVIAWLLEAGLGPLAAAGAGVLAGGVCGLVNGLLITRLRVVPFIVTLGTLLLFRGAAIGVADEQKIDAPETWLYEILATLRPEWAWMIVPPGVWAMGLAGLAVGLGLRYTRAGRHVVAVGSNQQTARLCGIAVDRVKVGVYTLAGLCAGAAGLMQFSRLTVGDPTVARGLELDVIAAVVIGGGSLSGGEGSVLGTLVGALIMATIRAGCSMMNLPNWVQQIVTGVIIVVAVALDRVRHR